MNGYVDLIRRNAGVRRVWLAQVVSELGDWLNLVALFQLTAMFRGTASATGWVIIVQMLPWVVWSPIAGVFADRFDRRRLMIGADVVRAMIVLGFLAVDRADRLWLLYVLAGMQFSVTAFFEPARSALLPRLASGTDLLTANALGSVTWSVMLAVGGAFGGLICGLLSPQAAFVVDSTSFLGSAALLLGVRHSISRRQSGDVNPPEVRVGAALQQLRSRARLLTVLLVKTGLALSGGGLWLLTVVIGQRVFPVGKQGAISVGALYAAHGLGAILGAGLTNRFFRRDPRHPLYAILVAFVLRGVLFCLLGWAPNLPLALAATAGIAACGSLLWVASTNLLQSMTADEIRGRMFSLEFGSLTLALALALWSTGAAMDVYLIDPRTAAYATGGVAGLVAIAWVAALAKWTAWGARESPREGTGAAVVR